jgi:hypothetical protein
MLPSSTLHAAAERFSSRTSHCDPRMSERTARFGLCAGAAPLLAAPSVSATAAAAHSNVAVNRILFLKGMCLLWFSVVKAGPTEEQESFCGRRGGVLSRDRLVSAGRLYPAAA